MNKSQHKIIRNGMIAGLSLALAAGVISGVKNSEEIATIEKPVLEVSPQSIEEIVQKEHYFPDFIVDEALNQELYTLTEFIQTEDKSTKITRDCTLKEKLSQSPQYRTFLDEVVPEIFPTVLTACDGDSLFAKYMMGKAYAESRGRHFTNGKITKSSAGAVGIMQVIPKYMAKIGINPQSVYELEGNLIAGTKWTKYYESLIGNNPLRVTMAYRDGIKAEENILRALNDMKILGKKEYPTLDVELADEDIRTYWDLQPPSAKIYLRTIAVIMAELGESQGFDTGNQEVQSIHLVKNGETLSSISRKYYSNPNQGLKRIIEANEIIDPNTIGAYKKLAIPLD